MCQFRLPKRCLEGGNTRTKINFINTPKLVWVLTACQATRRCVHFTRNDICFVFVQRCEMNEPASIGSSFLLAARLFHFAVALHQLTGSQHIHQNDLGTTTSAFSSFDQTKKCNVLPLCFPDTSRWRWSSFFWLTSRVHYNLPLCTKAVISTDFKLYSAKISADNYQCNSYYSNNPK